MASNPQETITVKFIPDGQERLVNAIKSLDRASKSLTNAQNKLLNSTKKLENAQNQQRKTTRILGGTFAVLRSRMLLFSFAMSLGVRQLGRFVLQASKVESMERAFTTLTGATEDSSIAFAKLQEATDGTMSEFDLFQQANNAMILGVSKNSDEMAEMFDIAQRLGRALGRDTASSVESLITGIGRQSRLMLDNIGIIVKSDEAYESYANKLGKSVDSLTDAEKKQAFLQATMESARAKVKTLGDETLSSQDAFDRLSSSTQNLVTFLGEKLSPITAGLASDFANIADAISGKGMKEQENRQKKLNELLTEYNFRQKDSSNLILDQVVHIDELMNAMFDESEPLSTRAELMSMSTEELKNQIQLYKDLLFQAVEFQGKQTDFNDIFRSNNELNLEISEVTTRELQKQKTGLEFLNAEQKAGVQLAQGIGNAFAQATLNGQDFGDAVVNSLKAIASQLISQMAVYSLLNVFTGGAFGAGMSFFRFAFGHTGGYIKEDKTIQRFATGGQVQGEDNVPIMAQSGEFIMSRNAVESIGIDNLHTMNQTGTAGVTINIQGNMIGNQEFVRDTLIPEIDKTINGGFA
jgi:hypothetical protein